MVCDRQQRSIRLTADGDPANDAWYYGVFHPLAALRASRKSSSG
jgi:hypothetical protein